MDVNQKIILYMGITLSVIMVFIVTAIITFNVLNNRNKVNNENNFVDVIKQENDEKNILKVILENNKEENEEQEVQNNIEKQEQEIEEQPENMKNNQTPLVKSNASYYIKVNTKANTVTIYKKDQEGNYTIPDRAMICSVGDYTPPCSKYPKEMYITNGDKYKWATLEGHVYGQYATRIVGGILFHSVPYIDGWKNAAKGSLEYWEYDKLGTKASLGCVRLTVEDAKWIYDNIGKGTIVEFYSDENPGPLGKPEIKKISEYPEYLRGWDPTDPDKSNPWNNYIEPEKTQTKENENIEEQTESKINHNTVVSNNTAISIF